MNNGGGMRTKKKKVSQKAQIGGDRLRDRNLLKFISDLTIQRVSVL